MLYGMNWINRKKLTINQGKIMAKHWKNIYSGSQLFYLLARLDLLLTSKLLSVRKDGAGTTKSMGLTLEC